MPKMGHDEPKKSPAELFNPANWGLVGWAWIMLFVVAGTGIFVVVYQSSVAPQPAPSDDRQVRRRAGSPPGPGEENAGGDYRPHPEAYEDQGRGGGAGGSAGSSDEARASSGDDDWNRSGRQSQFPKVFSGKHMNRTTSFEAPGSLRVEWTTTGPMFQVYVKGDGGSSVGAPVTRSGLSGTTSGEFQVDVEGEIYFKVNSLGNWELKVNSA